MEIIDATYVISNQAVESCPPATKPEYAFIGRSNVGKSSLINMLCNQSHLAKTSGTPGKTQLINHFLITSQGSGKNKKREEWYLVDLPGYGFAKVSQKERRKWEKMIEDYIRKRENLVSLFVLIDSRHSPQSIDLEFVNQLGTWGIPFCLLFTKADKNKTEGHTRKQITDFLQALKETWEELPVWFETSALKKTGRDAILDYLADLNLTVKDKSA